MELRQCTKCKGEFPLTKEFFCKTAKNKGGFSYFCIKCNSARVRKWEKDNQQQADILKKRHNFNRRLEALSHYATEGRLTCSCKGCGISIPEFLTLDHIDGDGAAHRRQFDIKGTKLYIWLKENNYPAGLQILCMNCNMAKGNKKECPVHSQNKTQTLIFDPEQELGLRIRIL